MSLQYLSLRELYQYQSQLEEMIELARNYQGIVEIDGVRTTVEELRDELNSVKAEIATIESNSKLKYIPGRK